MKILNNKYFIIGNLLLLLIAIPVSLFFIKQQQQTRSKAAPSSKLYFQPAAPTTSTQCSNFTVDLMVDPGSNVVSIVDTYLTYDPSKLQIQQIQESQAFASVVRATSISAGAANFSYSTGSDVTRAVQTPTKVATITLKALTAGAAQISIDQTKSRVFSLAPADQPTENVLFQAPPTNINVGSGACTGQTITGTVTLTPTVGPGTLTPTSTKTPTPTQVAGGGATSTPTPTTGANQIPVCSSLSVSPGATGSAPFSVLFTAQGNDPNTGGLITSGSFSFGDGQSQNVTSGLNLQNVTVQASHTYTSAGTFAATVTFTDNQSGISSPCSQTMTVTGASASATFTPTLTAAPISTATATPVPSTIPPTGITLQTIGVIAAVLLTIVGGFVLLAL